jgi:hypothetical protein
VSQSSSAPSPEVSIANPANTIIGVGKILRSVNTDRASLTVLNALERNDALDLPFQLTEAATPTELERWRRAYHESGHLMVAVKSGATDISGRLRADATGIVRCSTIANPSDRVTFLLAGALAETKYTPSAIHSFDGESYDFVAARMLIEEINAAAKWPVLTCTRAAETAYEFVRDHWRQIGNLALALNSAGELDDRDVRIFSSCRT